MEGLGGGSCRPCFAEDVFEAVVAVEEVFLREKGRNALRRWEGQIQVNVTPTDIIMIISPPLIGRNCSVLVANVFRVIFGVSVSVSFSGCLFMGNVPER